MQTTAHPFRKCHLQILRSLYGEQGSDVTPDDRGNEGHLSKNIIFSGGGKLDGATDSGTENGVSVNNDNEAEVTKRNVEALACNSDDSERPVVSEIWDLIERFLQQRIEYRPHKERQIHWAKINAEAKSRLDYVSSLSSFEEEKQLSLQLARSSSLTPRTPMFSVSGRGSSTQSLSLTPLSSNRNAPRLNQNDREIASTIPSWNFINQMLQRRSRLCTQSCSSIRSQPFLARLRNEAEMRCKTLERVLKRLKTGETKGGGSINILNPDRKRQKLGIDLSRPTVPSSLRHFLSNAHSESLASDLDGLCHDEDSIIEARMKIHLWSSLLLSVKEMADENESLAGAKHIS